MLQVSTLLREVIASMSVTLKIDSVEASGSNWKVYCSNTQYLNTLSELEIGSVQYVVESFVQDEYLILEGAVEPTPGIFALRNPTFKHGKYQAVLTELSDPQDLDIMPLIWMLENQQRTRPSELDSKIESEGQVRLFFANTDDWSRDTEQMYEEILNPVLTLVNLFLVELEANKRTGDFGVIETTNHAKLTIGGGDLGSTEAQGIFQRTLSGIEVTINLPIMVDFDCSDTASTRVCPQVSILDANGNIITMVDAGSSYTVSGGGGSGFVENSDSSYTNTVASGATLVLPDITVTDSDGSTSSVPSVQNVLCTPSADATVENSDSSYTNTVASGGTLTLPDITVTDSDGSTFTQPSVVNVVCSSAANATVYCRPSNCVQSISYANGDAAFSKEDTFEHTQTGKIQQLDHSVATPNHFNTLVDNDPEFGAKVRFTNDSGTSVFGTNPASTLIYDNLQGVIFDVVDFRNDNRRTIAAAWTIAQAKSETLNGKTYSNWYLAPIEYMIAVVDEDWTTTEPRLYNAFGKGVIAMSSTYFRGGIAGKYYISNSTSTSSGIVVKTPTNFNMIYMAFIEDGI